MKNNQKDNLSIQPLAGYPDEIGRWLWALEDVRQRTKQTLADIHPAVIEWSPPYNGNSIGTLLYHIMAIEMDWLFVEVLECDFPPEVVALLPYNIRDDRGKLTVVQGVSLEAHLARLNQARAIFLAAFREITLQEFRRQRSFENYDVTPEWVIYHLIQHETEHSGQIGELRLMAEQALRG